MMPCEMHAYGMRPTKKRQRRHPAVAYHRPHLFLLAIPMLLGQLLMAAIAGPCGEQALTMPCPWFDLGAGTHSLEKCKALTFWGCRAQVAEQIPNFHVAISAVNITMCFNGGTVGASSRTRLVGSPSCSNTNGFGCTTFVKFTPRLRPWRAALALFESRERVLTSWWWWGMCQWNQAPQFNERGCKPFMLGWTPCCRLRRHARFQSLCWMPTGGLVCAEVVLDLGKWHRGMMPALDHGVPKWRTTTARSCMSSCCSTIWPLPTLTIGMAVAKHSMEQMGMPLVLITSWSRKAFFLMFAKFGCGTVVLFGCNWWTVRNCEIIVLWFWIFSTKCISPATLLHSKNGTSPSLRRLWLVMRLRRISCKQWNSNYYSMLNRRLRLGWLIYGMPSTARCAMLPGSISRCQELRGQANQQTLSKQQSKPWMRDSSIGLPFWLFQFSQQWCGCSGTTGKCGCATFAFSVYSGAQSNSAEETSNAAEQSWYINWLTQFEVTIYPCNGVCPTNWLVGPMGPKDADTTCLSVTGPLRPNGSVLWLSLGLKAVAPLHLWTQTLQDKCFRLAWHNSFSWILWLLSMVGACPPHLLWSGSTQRSWLWKTMRVSDAVYAHCDVDVQ